MPDRDHSKLVRQIDNYIDMCVKGENRKLKLKVTSLKEELARQHAILKERDREIDSLKRAVMTAENHKDEEVSKRRELSITVKALQQAAVKEESLIKLGDEELIIIEAALDLMKTAPGVSLTNQAYVDMVDLALAAEQAVTAS